MISIWLYNSQYLLFLDVFKVYKEIVHSIHALDLQTVLDRCYERSLEKELNFNIRKPSATTISRQSNPQMFECKMNGERTMKLKDVNVIFNNKLTLETHIIKYVMMRTVHLDLLVEIRKSLIVHAHMYPVYIIVMSNGN